MLTLVAFGKSYTFRIKDRIFTENIESVSTAGNERVFYIPSPMKEEVGELKGMAPGGNPALGFFYSSPPGGSEQW